MGHGDGIITYRDGIAIAQVIAFSVPFLYALHFRRTGRIGWFTIGVFCLIRLIGAGCLLGTINDDSNGLWAGVFVCESLGVLLLIFTVLEGLERINKTTSIVQNNYIFYVPQILTYLDIGISIGGFVTVSRKSSDQLLPTAWSRASTAIMALIYLYTLAITLYFLLQRHYYAHLRDELRLIWCMVACGGLLLVRVLYSVIFVITADLLWNAIKGSPTIYLFMTFFTEAAFIGLATFVIAGNAPLKKEGTGGGAVEGE